MERTVDTAAIALVLALTAIPNNSPPSTNGQWRLSTNAPVHIVRLLSFAGCVASKLARMDLRARRQETNTAWLRKQR